MIDASVRRDFADIEEQCLVGRSPMCRAGEYALCGAVEGVAHLDVGYLRWTGPQAAAEEGSIFLHFSLSGVSPQYYDPLGADLHQLMLTVRPGGGASVVAYNSPFEVFGTVDFRECDEPDSSSAQIAMEDNTLMLHISGELGQYRGADCEDEIADSPVWVELTGCFAIDADYAAAVYSVIEQ